MYKIMHTKVIYDIYNDHESHADKAINMVCITLKVRLSF